MLINNKYYNTGNSLLYLFIFSYIVKIYMYRLNVYITHLMSHTLDRQNDMIHQF